VARRGGRNCAGCRLTAPAVTLYHHLLRRNDATRAHWLGMVGACALRLPPRLTFSFFSPSARPTTPRTPTYRARAAAFHTVRRRAACARGKTRARAARASLPAEHAPAPRTPHRLPRELPRLALLCLNRKLVERRVQHACMHGVRLVLGKQRRCCSSPCCGTTMKHSHRQFRHCLQRCWARRAGARLPARATFLLSASCRSV